MFRKIFAILLCCFMSLSSYAWDGTDYEQFFVDACASRNLNGVSECNDPGEGCLLIAEKYAIGELYNCYYQLCPGGSYNNNSELGGCTNCVEKAYMPFEGNNMDDTITWGMPYESDTISWRWYKEGAKNAEGCLYIATCPTGKYLTSDTLNEYNGTVTSDLYCKVCADDKYDKDASNIFILDAWGRGNSYSTLLAYTPSEGDFADVDAACGYTCPEHSHTNASGTGCECDTGYHSSGTDAQGQPICKGDMVDVELHAYVCNKPNAEESGSAMEGVYESECMDKCDETIMIVSDVLETGKTYEYDDFLQAVREKAVNLMTDCQSVLGSIKYNYINTEGSFSGDESITIPVTTNNNGQFSVTFCIISNIFPVRYYYNDDVIYNKRTYYNSGYTAMTAEDAKDIQSFTPTSGSLLSYWENISNETQTFKPGEDLSRQCDMLELKASEYTCSAGYYCSGWLGEKCPAGTTSGEGASAVSGCYLVGGTTQICGSNGCFSVPKSINLNVKWKPKTDAQ